MDSRRPGVRRPGEIDLRPLLRGQRTLLAGDPLDRDGVDGDDIEPREEALWPSCIRLAVFLLQHFAKALLDVALIDDANAAEQDDAGVSETGIALEASVVENLVGFVDFEADA